MAKVNLSTESTGLSHSRWLNNNLQRIFLIVLSCGLTLATPVRAEHEIDHRYAVEGFILDDSGEPVLGTNVAISVRGTTIGNAKTDIDGYYSIDAHLHDPDFGQRLKIVAGGQNFESRVTFKRGDKSTKRIHYINIVGEEMNEKKLSRGRLPSWVIVLAGFIIVIAALVFFRPEIKKLRRRFKPAPVSGNSPQPKKHKPKKKRRKR